MLRGRDVSRIEGFSDAVFGFALTLLVVSLEVPENFADLQRILVGFPAFAVTFSLVCWVWYEHYLLFRRYALEDGVTVALNCALLFLVVFYAYPLKFMFTRLISGSMLGLGPGISEGLSRTDSVQLMLLYSGGFVALFTTLLLLNWNVLRQQTTLGLDALGVYDARAGMARHAVSAAIGLVSVSAVLLLPPRFVPVAGMVFFAMGPAHGILGYRQGRAREKLEASLCRPSGTPTAGETSAAVSAD